jgi:ABC-type Fe3+-hydroxamate transport system substrate-binding protein
VVSRYPSRIVCLTEETTATLYLIGEGDHILVRRSHYWYLGLYVRPPEARQKPKVSAFINARFDKIEALRPDLILAFSDLQADIAAELIRRGHAVVTFNQRSIAEILQMIRVVGAPDREPGEEPDRLVRRGRGPGSGSHHRLVVRESEKKRTIVERPGWDRVSAVRADHIYEIKSTYILQPGPAALTDGVTRLHDCIRRAVAV